MNTEDVTTFHEIGRVIRILIRWHMGINFGTIWMDKPRVQDKFNRLKIRFFLIFLLSCSQLQLCYVRSVGYYRLQNLTLRQPYHDTTWPARALFSLCCLYIHFSLIRSLSSKLHLYCSYCGPGRSVGIATECGLDGPGSNPGGDEIFRPYRSALGPTQPPV